MVSQYKGMIEGIEASSVSKHAVFQKCYFGFKKLYAIDFYSLAPSYTYGIKFY